MGDNSLVPSVEKSTGRGRLRKARLADTKGVTRAEDIPEYRGQMSVDDLVEFINSGRAREKDSTRTKTIRNNDAKNNSKKCLHESFETGLKLDVRSGKLSEEVDVEEEQMKEPEKTESTGNKGVNPNDALDLDSEASDVAWNDFTIVSRKRKGKTQLNRENSPNEVNLTFDIKGRTGFNRENSTNEMNLTSDVRVRTRFNWENRPSEVHLTPQVNKSCPQVERIIGKLKGNKQSKAVMCENKSVILNAQYSSAQDITSSQSREVTAVQDGADKVNPALAATYRSSKNGCSILSQKPSQDLQIEMEHCNTHQTGSHDYESRVSLESRVQSPSTKVASDRNSETKGSVAKSSYLCPPVVFTNRNHTEFEKLVDISFGFDVQDAESGLEESANCVGSETADCSSASNDCRCSQEDVTSCTDKKLPDKSPSVLLTRNCSDENNHSFKVTRNTTAQSATHGDSETKKMLTCARLLMNTTYQHNSISRNGEVEKHKVDSTKEQKKATMGTLDNTASAKENPDKMLSSDKFEVQRVNCTASSKKNLTASAKIKRVTNSVTVRVISADPCVTSLSSTGRPVSVVAPNQCSSGQSSCSSSGYGSSSSGHSESPSLSSVKSECSSQNFCSSLVHSSPSSSCHGSSTILGPCVRAPVVKVAPMPVEKLVSNPVRGATAKSCTEDPLVHISNSRCKERTLQDDQSSPCNTFTEDEDVHEFSFLTEGCEVVKLESGPCEHDYKVCTQEPFSHKQDCNVHKQESCSQTKDCNIHKQEQLLHKLDCDFVRQGPCLQRTQCSLATKSDGTDPDPRPTTNSHPLGNAFHLVSAQIYLYKCKFHFTSSVCSFHFVHRFSYSIYIGICLSCKL